MVAGPIGHPVSALTVGAPQEAIISQHLSRYSLTTTRWRVVVMDGVGAATAFALLLGELVGQALEILDADLAGG